MIKRTTHEHIERARKRNKETEIVINPTSREQVPAIQRYKIGYASDEWGVRSLSPVGIYDDVGPWVLYKDHAAEVVALRVNIEELETQLSSSAFSAADMATAAAQGFRDGVASVAASAPAPSAHIKEPYTEAEIKAKIASNDYSAELLLQHAMLLLDSACRAKAAIAEMRNKAARGAEATAHDLERFVSMLAAALVEAQQPVTHDEDLLEQLYWDFDSQRKKTGEERLAFKGKMRSYASAVLARRSSPNLFPTT